MAVESADEPGFGRISRVKGQVFKALSFGASVFGLIMLAVLLVYVVVDAFGLSSASPEWLLTYFVTLVLPVIGFFLYSAGDREIILKTVVALGGGLVGMAGLFIAIETFIRPIPALNWQLAYLFVVLVPVLAYVGFTGSREPVGRVGLGFLGRLLAGVGLGCALVILFVVFSKLAWFWAYTLGLLPAAGVLLYSRRRPTSAMSMFTVPVVLAGLVLATNAESPTASHVYLAVLSLPALVLVRDARKGSRQRELIAGAAAFVATFGGGLAVSIAGFAVQDIMATLGVYPTPWITYSWTFAIPLAVVAAVLTNRDTGRQRALATGGLVLVLVVGGSQAAAFAGYSAQNSLLFLIAVGVPAVTYIQRTLEKGTGRIGLVFPVLIVAGVLAGAVAVRTLGIGTPDSWLDYAFLTTLYSPFPRQTGFYPPLVGSVLIISMVAVFSFVLGVGTAIFLEDYAPDTGVLGSIARVIEVNIANLAAVPSVVYGLLGLGVFVNAVGMGAGTALTAALTLSLLIMPITIISAREAVRAVPDSMRNGSYAMGATRWQTTKNVVLPEAMPGILTGTILALGRAIGETAPLLMIGVPNTVFDPPSGISDKASAMPMQIYVWSSSAKDEFRYGVLAAGVVTLLVVLLAMNATAIIIRNRSEQE